MRYLFFPCFVAFMLLFSLAAFAQSSDETDGLPPGVGVGEEIGLPPGVNVDEVSGLPPGVDNGEDSGLPPGISPDEGEQYGLPPGVEPRDDEESGLPPGVFPEETEGLPPGVGPGEGEQPGLPPGVGPSVPQPDLVPSAISFVVMELDGSPVYKFSSTVKNVGDADASRFSVEWFVDNTLVMTSVFSGGLASGASLSTSAWWPNSVAYAVEEGSHDVVAVVDTRNDVAESDEGNNARSLSFTVSAPPQQVCVPGEVLSSECSDSDGSAVQVVCNSAGTGNFSRNVFLQQCIQPQVTESFYRCSADGSRIERCDVTAVNPDAGMCSDADYVVEQSCAASQVCAQSFVDRTIRPVCQESFVTPPPAAPRACTSAAWSCTAFAPSVCPASGVRTRVCTLVDFSCSNPNAVKPSETQSCTPADVNQPPVITSFTVPLSADLGSDVPVSVSASDSDGGVSRIEVLDNGNVFTASCGNAASCSRSFAITVPDAFDAPYTVTARVTDSKGSVVTQTKTGMTNPGPQPVNERPVIDSFTLPSSGSPGQSVEASVTASDSDGSINRIEILSGASVIASKICGSASCTRTFSLLLPDAFDTAYTFVARVFDDGGASVSVSRSGRTISEPSQCTAAAWSCTGFVDFCPVSGVRQQSCVLVDTACENPEAVKPSVMEECVEVARERPGKFISLSSVVPADSCVRPGADTFVFATVRNDGDSRVKDVKLSVIVHGLDARVVSGPFDVRSGDSVSRILPFSLPAGTGEGIYYVRATASSDDDSTTRYRVLEVNLRC